MPRKHEKLATTLLRVAGKHLVDAACLSDPEVTDDLVSVALSDVGRAACLLGFKLNPLTLAEIQPRLLDMARALGEASIAVERDAFGVAEEILQKAGVIALATVS